MIDHASWTVDHAYDGRPALAKLLGVSTTSPARIRTRLAAYLREGDPWKSPEMADYAERPIDLLALALLRHHGIRADAMMHAALLGGIPEVRHDIGGGDVTIMPAQTERRRVRVRAWIARGVHWDALDGIGRPRLLLRREPMPHSVLAALPGRPLSDVLRHPALDGMDLRVTDVEPFSDGQLVHVRVEDPGEIALRETAR